MGLPHGDNFIILIQPFLPDPSVWQTDWQAIAYSALSILCYMLSLEVLEVRQLNISTPRHGSVATLYLVKLTISHLEYNRPN